MTITFRALGALLAYPDQDLVDALPEIRAAVDGERRLGRREKAALAALIDDLGTSDLLDAQEAYVGMFDRGRRTSLHLFEHVHGDSRDRGTAMLDLRASTSARASSSARTSFRTTCRRARVPVDSAVRGRRGDARRLRAHPAALGEALQQRESPYAAVFAALLSMVRQPGLAVVRTARPPRRRSPSTRNGSRNP